MSCGRSADEARHNLREAVALFVSTALEQGTLPAILRECGYRMRADVAAQYMRA